MRRLFCLLLPLLLSQCAVRKLEKSQLPNALPIAVSNNAVAYLNINGQHQFYTFNGLKPGRTYQEITNQAFVWHSGEWHDLNVPAEQLPVLASVAVSVKDSVYLFGGYTVAADHSEKSIPNVWRIDGFSHQWQAMPAMPTPVDDAVALVYQDRYIYLISGWHDVDNVSLVQVFDTETKTWQQATEFPLPPVFGHAGGIVENQMIVCDGVKVVWQGDKKQFLPSPECALGFIDEQDISKIHWQKIPHHSGTAFYRMAASRHNKGQVYFAGGSDNPYNYDGIGYDGTPSKPSSTIRIYDFQRNQWRSSEAAIPKTMDHRGLLSTPAGVFILGGMAENQTVVNKIIKIKEE